MSKDVIHVDGEDVVVREDTAKGFRWGRFAVIIFTGIILILLVWIVWFSGWLTFVQQRSGPADSANQNRSAGP